MVPGARQIFGKFQADRGPQLGAMIAYYALLSFVPLIFITVSIFGLFGRTNESSSFVKKLGHIFPDSSLTSIAATVNAIQDHATLIGILGLLFLVWSSLSLFGAFESAFNIVYGRPNRSFVTGKIYAALLLLLMLVFLFVGLTIATIGYGQLEKIAPGISGNSIAGYALPIVVSSVAVFVFLLCVYYYLTNVEHTVGDVLPGAILATVLLEITFQALPAYLRLSRGSTAQQAFGGPVLLLVWLYLMANVTVLGAELNWYRARHRVRVREDVPGLA